MDGGGGGGGAAAAAAAAYAAGPPSLLPPRRRCVLLNAAREISAWSCTAAHYSRWTQSTGNFPSGQTRCQCSTRPGAAPASIQRIVD